MHAGLPQEVGEGRTDPARVPHVGPADLVRDAGDRDVALDHRSREEVVEAEADLVVDHPVDAERPRLRIDRGHEQRRVHAIEGRVRGEERRRRRARRGPRPPEVGGPMSAGVGISAAARDAAAVARLGEEPAETARRRS